MNLRPLGDRVVLKQLAQEETTKSGIVLPGQNKEKPEQAEVIAVGPGTVEDGKEIKMQVKVGDKVVYSKYSGNQVKLDNDEEYVIVRQSDILAVIEEGKKVAVAKEAEKPAPKKPGRKPAAAKTPVKATAKATKPAAKAVKTSAAKSSTKTPGRKPNAGKKTTKK